MTITEMIRDLKIEPCQIGNPYINTYILSELQKVMKTECTMTHGHIINVAELKEILDNKIENSSSDIVLTVKFVVDMFKPVVGDVHPGTVIAQFTDGVLVELYGVQKLLIVAATIPEDKVVEVGDMVEVRITAVRYNDHAFSCIGVFV
jgi:DNA-directed RNA polymerase subunit E'/Rpb7